jgi:hypothetical protein
MDYIQISSGNLRVHSQYQITSKSIQLFQRWNIVTDATSRDAFLCTPCWEATLNIAFGFPRLAVTLADGQTDWHGRGSCKGHPSNVRIVGIPMVKRIFDLSLWEGPGPCKLREFANQTWPCRSCCRSFRHEWRPPRVHATCWSVYISWLHSQAMAHRLSNALLKRSKCSRMELLLHSFCGIISLCPAFVDVQCSAVPSTLTGRTNWLYYPRPHSTPPFCILICPSYRNRKKFHSDAMF